MRFRPRFCPRKRRSPTQFLANFAKIALRRRSRRPSARRARAKLQKRTQPAHTACHHDMRPQRLSQPSRYADPPFQRPYDVNATLSRLPRSHRGRRASSRAGVFTRYWGWVLLPASRLSRLSPWPASEIVHETCRRRLRSRLRPQRRFRLQVRSALPSQIRLRSQLPARVPLTPERHRRCGHW